MHVQINSRVSFTADGKLGAMLFVAAPLVGGASYVWFVKERLEHAARYSLGSDYSNLAALLMAASVIAWGVGVALMLVGRHYHHDVRIEQKKPTFGPIPDPAPATPTEWDRAKAGG